MPEDISKAFGKAVKQGRKAKHLTQEELSEVAHVSTRHLANIENAKVNPSFQIACILVKELNISMDNIIYNTSLNDTDHFIKELQARLPEFTQGQKDFLYSTIHVFESQNNSKE